MSDVDKNCGPFSTQAGSHEIVKRLRQSEINPKQPKKWRFGRYYGDTGLCEEKDWKQGCQNNSQNHYPDVEYNLDPIIGPAGTLIIFDSNVIHRGGNIKKSNERLVLRTHSW